MTKLFISYRSLDSSKVDMIVSRLKTLRNEDGSVQFELWQDKTSIKPGDDWWEAIVDGIFNCEVFVLMLSEESAKNVNCRAELSFARKLNRPIIPIALEDEYYFNRETGKNDIKFWKDTPDELKQGRFQFLFYEGTSFVNQLDSALARISERNWPTLPADRPPDPRHVNDANNDNTTIYNEACDHALRGDFDAAEEKFLRLVNRHDEMFGDIAFEWVTIMRSYKKIASLHRQPHTRFKIPEAWGSYLTQFPKPFIDIFDPQNLNQQYGEVEFSKNKQSEDIQIPLSEDLHKPNMSNANTSPNIDPSNSISDDILNNSPHSNSQDNVIHIPENFLFNIFRNRKRDIEHTLAISLQEAYTGAEKIIEKGGTRIQLKIPQGIDSGTKIRIKGHGHKEGDLYLVIELEEHEIFKRLGNDLYLELDVFEQTLKAGDILDIPTMDEIVQIEVSEDNLLLSKRIQLIGKGMPDRQNPESTGDLYVNLVRKLPQSLGIETLGGVTTFLIEKGTLLPASISQTFSTADDNQTQVEIHGLLGNSVTAIDNKSLGKFLLDQIPYAKKGIPQIEVTYTIDEMGMLNISALDKSTHYQKDFDPINLVEYVGSRH